MATATQFDFSDIAKPLGGGKPDSGGGGEDWTANPKGEGVYTMNTADGGSVRIPYSKVLTAGKSGYKLDPKDYGRFMGDFHFAHKKDAVQPRPEDEFASSGIGETAERKGYSFLHGLTDLLPTAGTIGGAMVAAPLAAAAGVPTVGAGTVAVELGGAAAGAGIGEAARQAIDHAIWGEEYKPGRIGTEMAFGAVTELGGRALAKPLKMAAEYFEPVAAKAAQAGFRMLPSEAQGKAAGFLERYAKGSLFSKYFMDTWRETQNKETLAAAEKLATDLSGFKGTDEQLGQVVQKGVESYRKGFRLVQDAAYKQIDNDVRSAGITPSKQGLIDFAKKELARIEEAKVAGGASVVSPKYEQILQDVIEPPAVRAANKAVARATRAANKATTDAAKATAASQLNAANKALAAAKAAAVPTYQGMARARSAWLEMSRSFGEELGGAEKGLVKQMAGLADQAMEDAAKKSTVPGLLHRVRAANELTARTHKMFDMKLISSIMKKEEEPSTIARLLTLPSISHEQVETMMTMLPANYRPMVQSHVINNLVKAATKPGKVPFNEREFADAVLKITDGKGEAIFGAPHWQTIKKIAGYMSHVSGEVGSRGGGAAELANPAIAKDIALGGAGLLFGHPFAAGGGLAAQAAGINAFAYALRNPETAAKLLNYLQKGMRYGPYGIQAGANLLTGAANYRRRQQELQNPAAGDTGAAPEATPEAAVQDYSQFAVGQDGHMIGYDGTQWVDLQTGAPVQ